MRKRISGNEDRKTPTIKYGPTCEEAMKSFNDLGEVLRKGMTEEPQSDWKILDVNCLPDNWSIKGIYEFECNIECGKWIKDFNKPTDVVIAIIENGAMYRYRPTQTKKTNEELAEEYVKKEGIEPGTYFDKNFYFQNGGYGYDVGVVAYSAFIAGRKSMEGEK